MSTGPIAVFEQAVALRKNGTSFVMVTVVDLDGSAPCKPGFRMLVPEDGPTLGTVGGGALEKRVIDDARRLMVSGGGIRTVVVDTADLGIGKARVTLLYETFRPSTALWILGAGHVCRALVPMVAPLDFRVVVVDSRPDYARPDRFPGAVSVLHRDYADVAAEIPAGAFVVITTHTHADDFHLLVEAASREPPFPYVGMIGSAKKVRRAHEKLRDAGVRPGPNVYTPIGLDLGGGGTAADIALSIAAEIQAVRGGGAALAHRRENVPFS